MPASLSALPSGTRLEEFEILELVGEGGFGIVYLARDHMLQRNVALKEYMPSALATRTGPTTVSVKSEDLAETFVAGLKSFVNEARLLARFDHPSLVKVYRFWEANGTAYMVMPFYEGVTVRAALLALGGPPTERWLEDLLRPLLDVLAYLHRAHCFHRDIAPDNILILRDGRPLLLDFGAARQVISDMTQGFTVILKPGYAPVEQYAATLDMKQGPWTDIYALASVVYFAITGKTPLPSVERARSDSLQPVSRLAAGRYGERFLKGVDKALAVRPTERPQDVGEFCALLGLDDDQHERAEPAGTEAESAEDALSTTRPMMLPQSRLEGMRIPRTRLIAWSAGAVVLAAAVASAWFFLASPTKPPTVAPEPTPPPARREPMADRRDEAAPALPAERPRPIEAAPALPAEPRPIEAAPPPVDRPRPIEPQPRPPVGVTRPAPRTPAPRREASSPRCSDILERAQLGEPLTPEEQATLKRGCP